MLVAEIPADRGNASAESPGPHEAWESCGRSPECRGESDLGQSREAQAAGCWGHGEEFSFAPFAGKDQRGVWGRKERGLICTLGSSHSSGNAFRDGVGAKVERSLWFLLPQLPLLFLA